MFIQLSGHLFAQSSSHKKISQHTHIYRVKAACFWNLEQSFGCPSKAYVSQLHGAMRGSDP